MAIQTDILVERYNQCLAHMGIAPTQLTAFHVDMIGWSPEIAEEKADMYYLSHGFANALGIILSIEQSRLALYLPYYSFIRQILAQFYQQSYHAIIDMTTQTGICLDIENQLSHYHSPNDLFMLNHFEVVPATPIQLTESARAQKQLIVEFEADDDLWMDVHARQAIIDSAKQLGDLRFRQVEINPLHFNCVRSYFSLMFGGVYVFKQLQHWGLSERMLVVLDEQQLAQVGGGVDAYYVGQRELISILLDKALVTIPSEYYLTQLNRLDEVKAYILADTICYLNPEMDYLGLSPLLKKKYIHQYHDDLPSAYFEIEKMRADGQIMPIEQMSYLTLCMMVRPNEALAEDEKAVIHSLLGYLNPQNVIQLYQYNKAYFYQCYNSWTESKRAWVIDYIQANYYRYK